MITVLRLPAQVEELKLLLQLCEDDPHLQADTKRELIALLRSPMPTAPPAMAPPPLPPTAPPPAPAAAAAPAPSTEEEVVVVVGSEAPAQGEVADKGSEPSAPTTPAQRVGDEDQPDRHGFGLAFDGAGAQYDGAGGGVLM